MLYVGPCVNTGSHLEILKVNTVGFPEIDMNIACLFMYSYRVVATPKLLWIFWLFAFHIWSLYTAFFEGENEYNTNLQVVGEFFRDLNKTITLQLRSMSEINVPEKHGNRTSQQHVQFLAGKTVTPPETNSKITLKFGSKGAVFRFRPSFFKESRGVPQISRFPTKKPKPYNQKLLPRWFFGLVFYKNY